MVSRYIARRKKRTVIQENVLEQKTYKPIKKNISIYHATKSQNCQDPIKQTENKDAHAGGINLTHFTFEALKSRTTN